MIPARTVLLIWDNGEEYEDHHVYFVRCASVDEAKRLRLLCERIAPRSYAPRGFALGIVQIEEWLSGKGELRTIAWFLFAGPMPHCHASNCPWPAKACSCGQAEAETWIAMSRAREPVDVDGNEDTEPSEVRCA